MIKLHGFAGSNYHNKVKLALLEKGAAFEEVYTPTRSEDPAVRGLAECYAPVITLVGKP